MNYDVIKYDAGDIRNTSGIEDITKHNMADRNIMSLFNKKARRLAIIMDEIDGMKTGIAKGKRRLEELGLKLKGLKNEIIGLVEGFGE